MENVIIEKALATLDKFGAVITTKQPRGNMNIVASNPSNSDSPFDSIRRYDEHGNEYWIARELMGLMGYVKWERFENPISQAIENLELNQDKVSDHFFPLEGSYKGQVKRDFKLTRYASYMTALCCDGRKPEVAAAKKYFAIKTRQAETVIPQLQSDNETLRLMIQLERERNKGKSLDHSIISICGPIVALKMRGCADDEIVEVDRPVLEVLDRQSGDRRRGMSMTQLNAWLKKTTGQSFKSGADVKRFLEQKAPELIDIVQRPVNTDWVHEDNIDAVMRLLSEGRDHKQLFICE